jgi:L-threonylcarbamoyladenylate synthase
MNTDKTLCVADAAARIRAGGVVAFPTETVYGLGANALDAGAVRKIFELKGRPQTSPLIVHVASTAMAREIAEWPEPAEELAARFWPGPLTLVLPKKSVIPDIVTAGLQTVGVRMPDHPLALELIREAGVPIAAPSANRFTGISPTTAEHVRIAFGDLVPVLDGGATRVGIESTVIAIEGGKLKLLRPGMISLGELEQQHAGSGGSLHLAHPAPGMHARHYSPRTPVLLVQHPRELPNRAGAYLFRKKSGIVSRCIRMPAKPEEYAARLYAALHELDQESWHFIGEEMPTDTRETAAIRDRLLRARGSVS